MTKIYRNKQGIVINIGEWDYMSAIDVDSEGVTFARDFNPLPVDAVESDEEVVEGWDGGLYAHDDERQSQ